MEWFRWYHGAMSDPKWPIIARRSKQNIGTVVSVWVAILEHASQDEERGSLEGFDPEAIDALYGYDDGTTQSVVDAMESKGLLVDGCVASWGKRQPGREREDDNSTERVRRFRAKKAQEEKANYFNDETPCNANVTPCNANETPCNANETPLKRQETPRTEQNREEQNREENKTHTARAHAHAHVDQNPASPEEGVCVFSPSGSDSDQEGPPLEEREPIYALGPPGGEMYSREFLELWDAYPRKESMGGAWNAFKHAKRIRVYPGNPIALPVIVAWRVTDSWTMDGGRFVPLLSRWLSERRWDDGPPESQLEKQMRQIDELQKAREAV